MRQIVIIAILTSSIIALLFFLSAISSIVEKERRAAIILFFLSLLFVSKVFFFLFYSGQCLNLFALVYMIFLFSVFVILFFPIKKKGDFIWREPKDRVDERDIVFSRYKLEPGSERYKDYYRRKAENKQFDDLSRSRPGLLGKASLKYQVPSFVSADTNFKIIEHLIPFVDGRVADTKQITSADKLSEYVKNWTKQLGAHSVGITTLKDYHKYTHVGRGDDYGNEVSLSHKYAIAITYEMKKEMIDTAPNGSVVMESSQVYLSAGTIALQLADFIRGLGYSARAHIDSNYRVICPLVARDAGLGEIGRMSLLITLKLGTRVRIAVVTTDIELIPDKVPDNAYILDFCNICDKCSVNCPTSAIPSGERINESGIKRWKLNANACFSFWTINGTDCGKCISICPFSHPNNVLHNFIRWGIKNNYLFARLAKVLDDIFYGKKPKSRKIPDWVGVNN